MPSHYTTLATDELPQKNLQKVLTQRYILAISIIFGLSLVGFLLIQYVISAQDLSATTINASGKQRMLSQRIAMYAEEHVNAVDEDAFVVSGRKLRSTLNLFSSSHRMLLKGNPARGISAPESEALQAIYFEKPIDLDAQVKEYIRLNKYILTTNYADRNRMQNSLKIVLAEADDRLLDGLERAVKQYEFESRMHVDRFKMIETTIFSVMILTLLLEVLFIFRPAAAHIGKTQKELERINILKSEFLANISNEIRTPFSSIVTMIGFLETEKLSPKEKSMVLAMQDSSKQLLHTLNNVLDISKIEYGDVKVASKAVHIRDLLSEVVGLFQPPVKLKHITLNVDIEESVPEYLLGDAYRLRQVIENLVSNAVKFTPDNGTVSVTLSHKNAKRLILQVEDSGAGMDEEKLKLIFDKYARSSAGNTREYGSSGLGLAVCRQLVALMKGKINVKSVVGSGTTFKLILPLVCPDSDAIAQYQKGIRSAVDTDAHYNENARILLVDDNALNRQLVRAQLERCNLQNLEFAGTGIEAIDMAEKQPFDLILMDCTMAELTDSEAAKKIRAMAKDNDHLKIVAMMTNVLDADHDKCLEAGMDDLIETSIETDVLRGKLQKWLVA